MQVEVALSVTAARQLGSLWCAEYAQGSPVGKIGGLSDAGQYVPAVCFPFGLWCNVWAGRRACPSNSFSLTDMQTRETRGHQMCVTFSLVV